MRRAGRMWSPTGRTRLSRHLPTCRPCRPCICHTGGGTHAGITYTVQGRGPPLVLLPFFLAPSQWEPAIAALAQRFTVIVLGGRHLGGVAALEDRAAGTSYRGDGADTVGCDGDWAGRHRAGCRLRIRARWTGCWPARLAAAGSIATDVNPFLLREAAGARAGRRVRRPDHVPRGATPNGCRSRMPRSTPRSP